MNNDVITMIANVALTLSFIVALVFGLAQIKAAGRDRRERLTLETLREFQTREFSELIQFVTGKNTPSTMKELRALPSHEQVKFIQFGQQMESLGIIVAEGLINIDLVDKTLGSFVSLTWERYKPLYTDIRETQPDPFMGEYFQWLAERIDKRMKENPRKPFYKTAPYTKQG